MLRASVIPPGIPVKRLPQGLVAELVNPIRPELPGDGPVPVRPPQDMAHLLQGGAFQLPPLSKAALLAPDVIPLQQVPQGIAAADPFRQALGVVPGINAAQALDADDHPVEKPRLLCRVDHGQGMTEFGAPDMDHIRAEGLQLPGKLGLQLGKVHLGCAL